MCRVYRKVLALTFKKKVGRFKAIFTELFELPKEIVLGLPRLTLVGNLQLLVENHRGVIAYSDQVIRVGASNGELVIRGKELKIKNLYAEELMVKGIIEGLDYEL